MDSNLMQVLHASKIFKILLIWMFWSPFPSIGSLLPNWELFLPLSHTFLSFVTTMDSLLCKGTEVSPAVQLFKRLYHIIRKLVGKGNVIIQKVTSVDNVTDLLTKAHNCSWIDILRRWIWDTVVIGSSASGRLLA